MTTTPQPTTPQPTTPDATDTSSGPSDTAADNDPRPDFDAAVATAASVIDAVADRDLRLRTPCSEFDVEDLTRHLISVLRRVVAMGEGHPAETVPLDAPDVAAGDWTVAWARATDDQRQAWADDAVLGQTMLLPFAEMPGAIALPIYTAEILIHTWDLASAIGAVVEWDQAIAERAYQVISFGIPAEGRGPDMPFDPVVPTPDGAPAIDRLVAWVGRHPAGDSD